ncbi:unnamed protein product [Lathyrus oleraceus]
MNIQHKIMVWNCRGTTNSSFYRYCKQYVEIWKPIVLVVMETRCHQIDCEKRSNHWDMMASLQQITMDLLEALLRFGRIKISVYMRLQKNFNIYT